jgi:hypothetical protein
MPKFLFGILIFKGLTVRRLRKSLGVQGLNPFNAGIKSLRATLPAEIFLILIFEGSLRDVLISRSVFKG